MNWNEQTEIPCSIVRGGTSKGVFFRENDLPKDKALREKVILRVFGSPDIREIDGLGGANSLTSKCAIVGPSSREDCDVDYTFGQVVIHKPQVDWIGNCGNISSGVGPFAVDEGLVKAVEPETVVRIHNTNTHKVIISHVPVKNGKAVVSGSYTIPGCPGSGAKIGLEFVRPDGSVSGKLVPTGKPTDTVTLENGKVFHMSVIDAANPVVFLRASELGLKGTELPTEVENMPEVLKDIEELRSRAAAMIGLVSDWHDATRVCPAIPKIGFVSPKTDYVNPDGKTIKKEDIDFVARLASMQKMHRAYMVTGAICTATAANIHGTVVNELVADKKDKSTILIGHPYGVMDVNVKMGEENGSLIPESVTVGRTARRIMTGHAYVPPTVFN